jgi:hypothetical protein
MISSKRKIKSLRVIPAPGTGLRKVACAKADAGKNIVESA